MPEFADFKNIYTSIFFKKNRYIVPLTGKGWGVKALAECPAENAFFVFV